MDYSISHTERGLTPYIYYCTLFLPPQSAKTTIQLFLYDVAQSQTRTPHNYSCTDILPLQSMPHNYSVWDYFIFAIGGNSNSLSINIMRLYNYSCTENQESSLRAISLSHNYFISPLQ
jgi:hypothetical protein